MTPAAIEAEPRLRPWMIGTIGAIIVVPLASIPSLAIVPILVLGMVIWTYLQPARLFLGWPLARLRKTFLIIFALGFVQMIGSCMAQRTVDLDKEAQRIAALGGSDPSAQAQQLAAAEPALLDAIDKHMPGAKKRELDRRAAATTAANRERVAVLVTEAEGVPDTDRARQIELWSQISELAPANPEYRARHEQLVEARDRAERIRRHPEEGVEVVTFQGRKGGFGATLTLAITLKNHAEVGLKDFKIRCEHRGPSGTVMDSNTRTLYESLAAGQQRRFTVEMGFIHGQAARTNCKVTDAALMPDEAPGSGKR